MFVPSLFKKIVFVICLCGCVLVNAQLRLNQIQGAEGLSQNTINSIIQDKNGFLWIATYNGINKYDGYSFNYYNFSDSENSLSSNLTRGLFEDKEGNIWAGTSESGLNRINPNTGKIDVLFNDEEHASNFKNYQLHQSASGIFFYKPLGGSYKFFNVSEEGDNLNYEELKDMSNNSSLITQARPSMNGNHWFYYNGEGIKLMQANVTNKGNKLSLNLLKTNLIDPIFDSGFIVDFYEHSENTIFFISNKLELVEIKLNEALQVISKKRIEIKSDLYDITKINNNMLNLQSDNKNRLWIGVYDLLLNYNVDTGTVSYLSENENYVLKNKDIKKIFIDRFNILWVGTFNDGIFKMDLENSTLLNSNEFIKKKDQYYQAFHQWPIKAMCEDNNGIIWLGADGKGGIAQIKENNLDQSTSNLEQKPWNFTYLNDDKAFQRGPFYNIRKLFNDSSGNIWVGSSAGLSKINTSDSTYDVTVFNDLNNKSFSSSHSSAVFAIEEDHKGRVWAGYWGNGLVNLTYNEVTKTYDYSTFYQNDKTLTGLSNNFIRDITEDSNKNIWVGTVGGLNKIKYGKNGKIEFEQFLKKKNTDNCLSNNHILDVFESKNGNIYVGTFGGGLNEIKISENNEYTFQHYTTKDGLPSDVVYQIKEDSEGNLWMMHIREISKLNIAKGEISYFEKQDGFNVGEFRDNSMLQTSSGLILCGGTNGFSFFDPKKLSTNKIKPQLVVTDFRLFNESVQVLEEKRGTVILDKNINEIDKIVLPYNLNSMEFAFSSLHFSNPNKNQYKYILEGFDEKWQYSKGNERRFASYTNVPTGDYIFKVNGSNSAGVWEDVPKAIAVVINKPWYLTTLALVFFSSLTLAVIYSVIKIRLNQIRLKSKLDIESAVYEKSVEMNQMKLQFFTNISHELRTPLTLIVGPLNQIMKGNVNSKDVPKLNSIMHRNSNRLLKLINQLLDFRKAESGNLNLIVQNDELVSFIGEAFTAFEDIALEKDIKFLFLSPEKRIDAWFDTDKIEKIVYNLLSNAFKFTPIGKGITVSLEKETIKNEAYAVIKVIDYGIGIAKEELENIFERFYQAKKENNSIHVGSGLGLAYIKRLVEIHKGRITIASELHKGTICTVSIPISKSAYTNDSIMELQPLKYDFKYTKIEVDAIKENQLTYQKPVKYGKEHTNETPLLLIVEDNRELQEYLVTFFSYDYRILTADNGEEGLKMAIKNTPNIIISDLMMPVMSGIDMCKKLKTDINTSHIPVIILTAKAGLENEKEGLETGADEFILKPFNIEVLKLRLDNILRTKQQWIQKFKTNVNSKAWKELSNKLDQKFMERSVDIIKRNINNTDFSVEKFALEIGMSRSALFLKIKSITGQSTSEFIRTIRLKRAVKLIKSGKYSVSEIVYMVGFSDPKYFRTCFKKQFGSTPSGYLNDFKEVVE